VIAATILTYKVTNDRPESVLPFRSRLIPEMIDQILQDLLQIGSSNALTRKHAI